MFGLLSVKERRAREAAKQMFVHLAAGKRVEIPATLSKEDDVTQMILAIRKHYPQVEVGMLQSKSIVLSMKKPGTVGDQAWAALDASGYLPDRELPPDMFLDIHREFMARNGVTPEQARAAAVREYREHVVEVKGDGKGLEPTETTPAGAETGAAPEKSHA